MWILMIYILMPPKYLNGVPLATSEFHVVHSSKIECEKNREASLKASKALGNSIYSYCTKQ